MINHTISIVIPNYNGEKLLMKNLPRLIQCINTLKQNLIKEIIIVDDGSTDESVGVIESTMQQFSKSTTIKFHLLQNKENLGFSSTVNRGVEKATGDLVLLLNTDVYPERGFLDHALPHFENEKMFAVGFLDRSREDDKVISRGRGLAKWEKGFLLHTRGEVNKTDTFWVSAGSALFRRKIWEELEGLEELYSPFYW